MHERTRLLLFFFDLNQKSFDETQNEESKRFFAAFVEEKRDQFITLKCRDRPEVRPKQLKVIAVKFDLSEASSQCYSYSAERKRRRATQIYRMILSFIHCQLFK